MQRQVTDRLCRSIVAGCRFDHEPDVSEAEWFTRSGDPWNQLCSIGPSGFAQYARLFHPLQPGDHQADRQSLMDVEGHLETRALQHLVTVLARHTTTPRDCLFGLWEGFGDIQGSPSVRRDVLETRGPRARRRTPPTVPPAFSPDVMAGPRVQHSGTGLPALCGPLSQAGQWGAADLLPRARARTINSPNLIWPADHAWFVATDIDLPWTGIAGSAQLIQDLMAEEALDVERIDPAAPLPYWRTGHGFPSTP